MGILDDDLAERRARHDRYREYILSDPGTPNDPAWRVPDWTADVKLPGHVHPIDAELAVRWRIDEQRERLDAFVDSAVHNALVEALGAETGEPGHDEAVHAFGDPQPHAGADDTANGRTPIFDALMLIYLADHLRGARARI